MEISMKYWLCAAGLWLSVSACQKSKNTSQEALRQDDQVVMVTEWPAGELAADHALLPAPGNMGGIAGTETSQGTPLICLTIGTAVKKGARIEVWPLGAVQWRRGQELHTCIVAIRSKKGQPPAGLEDFMALRLAHDDVRATLELWFQHHYLPRDAEWLGWQNEVYAHAAIERARLN